MKKKVKVRNLKTGVKKEVTEMLAGELIGTKEWEVIEEKEKASIPKNSFSNKSMNEE